MSTRRLDLFISPDHAGKTVDTLLRRELLLSGTAVKRAKRTADGITLAGISVPVGHTVAIGQTLSVLVGDTDGGGAVRPAPGPLEIVYEDGDLLVLCKAPGVAVHPGPGHQDDTLGNYVEHYYKITGLNACFRPVNRLDRGTSGLMVVAKHAHAQERLQAQLHTKEFQRVYLAVCEGIPFPSAGIIDLPIGRADGSALRRTVRLDGAPARTKYEVLTGCHGRSLIRLTLETGRTHQIRVHMAHLDCPLTGDFLYGTEDPARIARAALHSAELSLRHPITGLPLHFASPLPQDILALL